MRELKIEELSYVEGASYKGDLCLAMNVIPALGMNMLDVNPGVIFLTWYFSSMAGSLFQANDSLTEINYILGRKEYA